MTYACSVGYYVSGRSHVECRETGQWESHRPSCVRVTCAKPESVSHGYYREENAIPTPIFEYQATVMYKCELGYRMTGEATLLCLASGFWNGTAPSCDAVQCATPDAIAHGHWDAATLTYGSRVAYTCGTGHRLVGNSERTCEASGDWSTDEPRCELITCPVPLKPSSGFVSDADLTFNASVEYSCQPGYSLSGSRERRCTRDGRWSGSEPSCAPVECPEPRRISNGHVVGTKHKYLDIIEYTCEAGYRLQGWTIRRCIENATWSGAPPVCERVTCPEPKTPKHGDITDRLQIYLPGCVIHYTCHVGYEMEGKDSRTCREDGTWTGRVPGCNNIRCDKPREIKHGTFNAIDKAYKYGALAVYACEEGFQLDGPARRMCSEDRTWSGAEPECVHIECPELGPVTHGNVDPGTRLQAGDVATYKCDPGYELIGDAERECLMNGTWDSPAPYCTLIECDAPAKTISNGRMLGSVFTYGSTISYTCDPGYELEGHQNRTCLGSGQWDRPIPVCEMVSCPPPLDPVHGRVEGFDFRYTRQILYFCDKGYELQGEGRRTCTAAKVWDSDTPVCIRVQCVVPPNITNGEVHIDQYPPKYTDTIEYACDAGFELDGPVQRTCMADRTWSESDPECGRIKCGRPPEISNGVLTDRIYDFEDNVQYSCNPGFVLDASELTCGASGEFEGAAPMCTRITCPDPGDVENGHPVINGTRFEDFIIYKCDRGYRLIGEGTTRVCTADGSWRGEVPRCEMVTCETPRGIPNSVAVVKNTHNFGETLTIACAEGFELVGRNQYLCQANGTFGDIEAECVKITCPSAHIRHGLINGSKDMLHQSSHDYGTTLDISCEEGHTIQGLSVVTCTGSGTWEPPFPQCKPVQCPRPSIENSDLTVDERELVYERNLTIECITGYKVMGAETLTCTSNGTWYPNVPKCELVTCSHPVFTRANGRMIVIKSPNRGVGYPYGITIKFGCNAGFEMRGSDVITCLASGRWSNENPECVPVQCRKLGVSAIANLTAAPAKELYDIGEKVTFHCDEGFQLDGLREIRCEDGAVWSDPLDVLCREILCDAPQLPDSYTNDNPDLFQRKYKVGNVINYACNRGWVLEGSARATCLLNATWSAGPPTCKMITCSTLNVSNANVVFQDPSTKKMAVDTVVEIVCDEGHLVEGRRELRCQMNGTWSSPPPVCRRVQCATPLIQNARIRAASRELKFYYGDPLYVDCRSGYELSGAAELFCRADGAWSGALPVCNIVNCTRPWIRNGYIAGAAGVVSYGQSVRVKCDMGYTMKGPEELNCTSDGSWSDDIPVCGMVFCKTPSIEHGLIYTGSVEHSLQSLPELPFNQTIVVACVLGFEVVGASSLTCLPTGLWSDEFPVCNRLRCTDPEIQHGIIMGNRIQVQEGYGFGDSAKFSCEDGFELLGTEEIQCLPNGTWSDAFPVCRVRSCSPEPSLIQNAHIRSYPPITDHNYTYATRVQVTCHRGFRLIGHAEIACGPLAEWSGIIPVCHRLLCPNPSLPDGVTFRVYANQTDRIHDYGFGDAVNFRCDAGFELHGLASLRCQDDGTWNASFPVCVKKICHAPEVKDGWVESKIYRFGDNVTLHCDDGYQAAPGTSATCEADATWSATLACVKITCPAPFEIYHGEFTLSGREYGESVQYTCARGFVLNGTATRTCLMDRTWSGKAPTCERVDCGDPPSVENGDVEARSTKFGSRAKVTCDEGYNLLTSAILRCRATGRWSEEGPVCEAVRCERLRDVLPHVVYIASGQQFGDTVLYVCDAGYRMHGSPERVCESDGEWKGEIPDCLPVECPDPQHIHHGSFIGEVFTYGSSVNYTCDYGFELYGSRALTCLANATWSHPPPTCHVIQCPGFPYLEHGTVIGIDNTFGAVVEIMCDFGYELMGVAMRTCLVNATWSGSESACRLVRCPEPRGLEHGSFNGTFTFGSSVHYACDDDYDLFGPSRRMCQGDGTWTEVDPSCYLKRCPQPPAERYARMQADGGFAVGSHVIFHCERGYNLVGQPILRCKGNTWDAPFPECAKVHCGSPELGHGVMYEGKSFEFEDRLRLMCMTGYVLMGSEFCVCGADGRWKDTDAACEPISCGTPPFINNTVVLSRQYAFGEYVFYKCSVGYELTGNNLLQCNEMGEWVGDTPTCEMISCGPPPVIHRATTTVSVLTYGSRTTYVCNRGYILRGSDTLVCMENATWMPPESTLVDVLHVPRCDPVTCGPPPRIAHGSVRADAYTLAHVARYACAGGYRMVGVGILQCGAEGYWNGSAPRCLRITCPGPPVLAHAQLVTVYTGYDGRAVYACERDYEVVAGNLTLRCGADGRWSGAAPVCEGTGRSGGSRRGRHLKTCAAVLIWAHVESDLGWTAV